MVGFQQFAFICAVLAGFAFSYFGALLALSPASRAAERAAMAAAIAASALVVATLAATFIGIDAADGGALPARALAVRPVMAFGFVVGLLGLLCGLALGAWHRSRALGLVASVAAISGALTALWMFARYL